MIHLRIGMASAILLTLGLNLLADDLTDRGTAHLKRGEWQQAVEVFTQIITNKPDDAGGYLHRGWAYLAGEKLDLALTDAESALRLAPKLAGEHLLAAVGDFSAAIEQDANLAEAWRKRANAQNRLKKTDEALADIQQALKLQPNGRESLYVLGEVQWQRGDPTAAVTALTSFLEQADDWNSRIMRGAAYDRLGDKELALADFSAAIKLKPDDRRGYELRQSLHLSQGHWREQIADLDILIERFPAENKLLDARAIAWYQLGDFQRAADDYDKLIEREPLAAGYRLLRGNCRQGQANLEGAIADYTWVVEHEPRNPAAFSNRGIALASAGKLDDALADLTRAIELEPKLIHAWTKRARCTGSKRIGPRPSTILPR